MARPNWPCKTDHGPETQDHRHQALSGLGRHPQPADRQGRNRPGRVWLGRKRPVVAREGGGRRHRALPRVSHRPGRDADRPHLAGDVSQPVLRRRPRPAGCDLGDRHRPARHQGQGARRAGLRSAGRQAARSRSDVRDHAFGSLERGSRRAGARTQGAGMGGDPPHPGGPEVGQDLRAARKHRRDRQMDGQVPGGVGGRGGPWHRLPPSAERGGGRQLLPEDAARNSGLPRRTHSRRNARRLRRHCGS